MKKNTNTSNSAIQKSNKNSIAKRVAAKPLSKPNTHVKQKDTSSKSEKIGDKFLPLKH